jgi:DNA-directed RNA polymerase subunit N (RpoN/RPB10)
MLPLTCFTCGHLLADIQIPYENDLAKIDNDPKMSEDEKNDAKAALLDKYHVKKYCCRTRVLTYVRLIEIIT